MDAEVPLTAHDIQMKIASGRGEQVDWLDEEVSSDAIARTLAAMANSQGGILFIGITSAEVSEEPSTPHINGVNNISDAIDRVLMAALSLSPRLIIPMPHAVEVSGKQVIVVRVSEGMPHTYAVDGQYLHRDGKENAGLPPHVLRCLFMERAELSFDVLRL